MSSTALLTALRAEVRHVTRWDDAAALETFVDAVNLESRYFGATAAPSARILSAARLLHPASGPCLAAFIGDTIVGIGALQLPGASGGLPSIVIAVRSPWRRSGVATKLMRSLAHDDTLAGFAGATLNVGRNNRAALALGRACGMVRVDLDTERIELRLEYGRSFRRCA
jgi:GNAT superfamily N-acetyltransferase